MNWLILVAIAVIFDSTRIFLDNYLSDVHFKGRSSAAQKMFYGFFFVLVSFVIFLIFGIDFEHTSVEALIWFFVSGCLASLAGLPYYRALEIEDSTNLSIFIQMAPVLYLILGWFFLDEQFSPLQFIAFLIILAGPALIIMTSRKNGRKAKIKAVLMAILYVVLAVVGNLIFVKNNNAELAFTTPMIMIFLGKGVANLIIVYACPTFRRRFKEVMKKSKKKVLRPLIVDGLISVVKDFAYRGALIAAPAVALASAVSDSAEPIVIFLMGLILTLIWPKFGREKLTKKIVLVHLVATLLVVAGIIILQFI